MYTYMACIHKWCIHDSTYVYILFLELCGRRGCIQQHMHIKYLLCIYCISFVIYAAYANAIYVEFICQHFKLLTLLVLLN